MIVIAIVVLIALAIAAFYAIKSLVKKLKVVQLSASSDNPVQQPDHYKYKLLHYAFDITASGKTFGLFQTGNDFWLVDSSDISHPKNLRDIYPAFKGRPKGMVVIPGSQFNNSSFIIFSTDGKVYNPFSTSHPWRNDFLYLPNDDPISIDGRPLDNGISNGLFSGNGPNAASAAEGAILFRFYYPGYYIEETGCVQSGTDAADHPQCTAGSCPPIKSCTSKKVPINPLPSANINSFSQYNGTLYGVSSDGGIYTTSGGSPWVRESNWTTTFAGLSFTGPQTLAATKKAKLKDSGNNIRLYLMGADYDDGIPIFLIYENGTRYIVDRHARKYDFFHFLKDQSIIGEGNPLDITKAGPGEYDYIVLYSDFNIYGPSLPGPNHSRPVSDFEAYYPGVSKPISISSVNKWQNNTQNPGTYTFKYYLVFLYESGQWFEIQYDIASNTIGALGQTDQTSGSWKNWPHIASVLNKLNPSTQTFKLASLGWSIFVFDTTYNFANDMVYSINNPPESWIDMLLCTSTDDGNGGDKFKSSTCVGVGEWKDYIFSATGGGPPPVMQGFNVYEDYGLDTDANPGTVTRKVSLQTCLANNQGANVVVYDQAESDCHVYTTLTMDNTTRDPTKSAFVSPAYDPTFQNRFCVKHKPSNKYLYWDFVDPDNQFLGLMDNCSYNGPDVSAQASPAQSDVQNLQRALGAMWSLTATGGVTGLRNLNGAAGGFLTTSAQMSQTPDPHFNYINNNFTDGSGNCFHSDGTNFSEGTTCGGEWAIEGIPCAPNATGYMLTFCTAH